MVSSGVLLQWPLACVAPSEGAFSFGFDVVRRKWWKYAWLSSSTVVEGQSPGYSNLQARSQSVAPSLLDDKISLHRTSAPYGLLARSRVMLQTCIYCSWTFTECGLKCDWDPCGWFFYNHIDTPLLLRRRPSLCLPRVLHIHVTLSCSVPSLPSVVFQPNSLPGTQQVAEILVSTAAKKEDAVTVEVMLREETKQAGNEVRLTRRSVVPAIWYYLV